MNAREISHAKNKPNTPPRIDAAEDVIIPSMRDKERMSERFNPIARIIASSALRLSASIITIVRTNRTPAPIVNAPKTRNIADSAPAPSLAAAKASSLAGTILRFIDSTPDTSSSQISTEVLFPSLMTRILLSPLEAEASSSPSDKLTKPIMIDSSSSNPGASIDDILPSISKVRGNWSPYAQGTSPFSRTFSDEFR